MARWGGDEFVAVLREAEGAPAAEAVLEQIKADLAARPARLPDGERVRLGVSGGVARAAGGEDPAGVVERADAALYRAKRASTAAAGRGPAAAG